jgi:hypothetical protein
VTSRRSEIGNQRLNISLAARDVLAENCLVTKRALSAVAGVLALCLSLSTPQTSRADIFRALNSSVLSLPSLTLADGQLFSFSSALNWMEAPPPDVSLPADVILPTIIVTAPQRATASTSVTYLRDSSKEVVDVERSPNLFDYAGGEVGALYGRSSGKYGVEVEQGYIMGEVGNDKFHISAGASYENSRERVPRFGR